MTWLIIIGALAVAYVIYRSARRELSKGDESKDMVDVPGWAIFLIIAVIVVGIGGAMAARGGGESSDSYTYTPTTSRSTTSTTTNPTDGLSLVSGSLDVSHNGIGYLVLEGKIRNSGRRPLEFVKVRGYALDSSGATVNTDYSFIDSDTLAPGATATFSVYVSDPDDEATEGRVVLEGAKFAD